VLILEGRRGPSVASTHWIGEYPPSN